jgi:predicted DCC family thiol-disulfide oxidoreductase YuxK
MIKVYFDGICGHCSKEIKYYQTIAPKSVFRWIDVAADPTAMNNYRITQAEALRYLHAIDDDDVIHVGSDAFAVIWKRLPKWKMLGHMISLPIVRNLTRMAYKIFAHYRFKKNKHCQLASTKLY